MQQVLDCGSAIHVNLQMAQGPRLSSRLEVKSQENLILSAYVQRYSLRVCCVLYILVFFLFKSNTM